MCGHSTLTDERTESTAVFHTLKPPPCSHFWHCRWFPGRSPRQSAQARCPPLHCRNQSNNTSIKKPAPCSISRTDEVYSNLIHWRRQRAEAQEAMEHGEVHRDLRELHRRVMFGLHDLALLVHNHLSLGPGHYKALPSHIYTTSRCIKSTHASIKRKATACMHAL